MVGTRGEGEKQKLEVLAVAALKKEVLRYQQYIEAVHLKLDFLELETFSMVRSLIGQESGLVLLIDIGSRATNLVLAEEGIVKVSRNVDTGGKDLTRTIMESQSIAQDRAEALKKSTKDFLNSPESATIFPSLNTIFGEARAHARQVTVKSIPRRPAGSGAFRRHGKSDGLGPVCSKRDGGARTYR
ncbi:MAG: pilus assembly protein PilM [Candidatus Moraniibacteriota bacterium]